MQRKGDSVPPEIREKLEEGTRKKNVHFKNKSRWQSSQGYTRRIKWTTVTEPATHTSQAVPEKEGSHSSINIKSESKGEKQHLMFFSRKVPA